VVLTRPSVYSIKRKSTKHIVAPGRSDGDSSLWNRRTLKTLKGAETACGSAAAGKRLFAFHSRRLVQGRVQGRPFLCRADALDIGTEKMLASFGRHDRDNFIKHVFYA
jgi:hypothetical protein